jgi:flagellum-specific peptidoglycan hydrolase FlgJ
MCKCTIWIVLGATLLWPYLCSWSVSCWYSTAQISGTKSQWAPWQVSGLLYELEVEVDLGRQKRLNEVAAIAKRLEAETRVPARMLIAQWATESRWGTKPVGRANYFGIKKAARHDQCCTVATHEVVDGKRVGIAAEFADYASLEDACRDYAWLISHGRPYAAAWKQYLVDANVDALIAGIATVYATSPEYAALVTAIAGQTNVRKAIEGARC